MIWGTARATWLALLLPLLFPVALCAASLVKEGKPCAVLVVPDQPSPAARRAALVFLEHVQQISGAKLPVRKESEVAGKPTARQPWVLVGEGPLAGKLGFTTKGLGPGGILLQARDNVLVLMGTDSRTPASDGVIMMATPPPAGV